MVIECLECGAKNQTTQTLQSGKRYRCGKCGEVITFPQTENEQGKTVRIPNKESVYENASQIHQERNESSWSKILSPDGRSSRSEYALTLIAVNAISWVLYFFLFTSALFFTLGSTVFFILFLLMAYIVIAAGIRRLHDVNNSGWYLLFIFVPLANLALLLFMLFAPGKKEGNRWA